MVAVCSGSPPGSPSGRSGRRRADQGMPTYAVRRRLQRRALGREHRGPPARHSQEMHHGPARRLTPTSSASPCRTARFGSGAAPGSVRRTSIQSAIARAAGYTRRLPVRPPGGGDPASRSASSTLTIGPPEPAAVEEAERGRVSGPGRGRGAGVEASAGQAAYCPGLGTSTARRQASVSICPSRQPVSRAPLEGDLRWLLTLADAALASTRTVRITVTWGRSPGPYLRGGGPGTRPATGRDLPVLGPSPGRSRRHRPDHRRRRRRQGRAPRPGSSPLHRGGDPGAAPVRRGRSWGRPGSTRCPTAYGTRSRESATASWACIPPTPEAVAAQAWIEEVEGIPWRRAEDG